MLVYLDSNIWVYAYENHPVFGPAAQELVARLHQGRHRVASSLFVLNELLVLPMRKGDEFSLASYRRMFRSPAIELLPYTLAAAETCANLRAFQRVKAMDALHLAVAAEARVDLFLTQDEHVLSQTVAGIGRIADMRADLD